MNLAGAQVDMTMQPTSNGRTRSMMDVASIQELYRYNEWANDRIFEAVSGLTQKQFAADLGNSYPSVRDTLIHIVWAEWIWLQRWKGISPRDIFEATECPDFNVLKVRWLELGADQRAFVGAVTADRLR